MQVVAISSFLIFSVLFTLWMVLRILMRRQLYQRTGVKLFVVFSFLAMNWSLGSLLELLNPEVTSSIIFAKLQYISIVFLPPLWLSFLVIYTDTGVRFQRWLHLLFVLPLVNLIMVWTNELHGLVWRDFEYLTQPFAHTVFHRGIWFGAVIVPYAYVLLLMGFAVLIRAFWSSASAQRSQLYILLGAQLVPLAMNVLYMLRLSAYDFTPVGFGLSSMLLGFGLFRQGLMQQLPVAYKRVFNQMQDGVLVLDKEHRLLEFNLSARRYLGLSAKHYQQPIEKLYPELGKSQQVWVKNLEFAHGGKHFAISVSDLINKNDHQGYIVMVRDISERVTQQTKLERQARELELLDRVRVAVARQFNLAEVMKYTVEAVAEVFGYKLVSVYLLEDQELVLHYQVGYPKVIERIPVSQGVIGKVVRTGEPMLVTNPKEEKDFLGAFEGICSEVAVPLMSQGQVRGVLRLESTEHMFTTEDLRLLMALSEHVGMAIERAKLYDAISQNEKQLRLLNENMTDLICLHDLQGHFSYVSPSSLCLLGYEPAELLGKTPSELIHPEDLEQVRQHLQNVLSQGQSRPVIHRVRHKSGEYIWVEVFTRPIFEDGRLTSILACSRDVTERKRMEEQVLEGALLYDALTGLPNRVLLMDRLQQAFYRHYRDQSEFGLMFLDLDRFKIVNDTLGHSMGDLLLVEVARRIKGCVRAQDTVSRLGGDEFAILLEDLNLEELEQLAQRIQLALQDPFILHQHEISTSASIGIILGRGVADPETLLRHADMAMYRAKNNGKARYVLFDEAMHDRLRDSMRLEVDLRKALEHHEFVVHYQPIMDIDRTNLVGFEALVRWQHPERGMICPDTFIPIAEEVGLISHIDLWVLEQACQQLRLWQKATPHTLKMSVNVSAKSILRKDFARQLSKCIVQSAIQPQQLRLEITESILMDHVASQEILLALRQQGVGLVIDDFGTGYSSLSYLQTLPLDSLKMDRSFIELSDANKQIIASIIALAHSLELEVVAEGIETSAQLEHLRSLSCCYGQGFLFGKPMPVRDVERHFFSRQPLVVATES